MVPLLLKGLRARTEQAQHLLLLPVGYKLVVLAYKTCFPEVCQGISAS